MSALVSQVALDNNNSSMMTGRNTSRFSKIDDSTDAETLDDLFSNIKMEIEYDNNLQPREIEE